MSTFGFSQHEWDAAKEAAKEALIERAKVRGMMAYSELVEFIYAVRLEAHDIRLDNLLGQVSEEEMLKVVGC